MNDIVLFNKDQIELATIDVLKAELSRTLKVTSQYLVYMSMIWAELNKRGVDLSGLKSGLFEYIPLIAMNKLNPDLVIEFAGNKTLLSALSRVPIEQQNWIAETKSVAFAKIGDNQEKIETVLDLTKAKPHEIYQVFGGEMGIRNVNQQYALILSRNEDKKPKQRQGRSKTYKTVGFDKNREYMLLSDSSKVKLDTVIDRLGELYSVDLKEILRRYSNEIKLKK
ncbi:MAG: hypothetical protein GXO52_09955 [Gammaproteobacteria bacterium]|nr:hypothetical protein [Gammaproteobacteria bacterium]